MILLITIFFDNYQSQDIAQAKSMAWLTKWNNKYFVLFRPTAKLAFKTHLQRSRLPWNSRRDSIYFKHNAREFAVVAIVLALQA